MSTHTHTQPTEAHRKLAYEIYALAIDSAHKGTAFRQPCAQLIADSEARAVEAETALLRQLYASEKQAKVERGDMLCECQDALTAERERVKALREHGVEALMVARSWQMVWGDKLSPNSVAIFTKHEQAFLAALAATEGKT